MKPCSDRLLAGLKSLPDDQSGFHPSPTLLADCEACVSVWTGQLEQVTVVVVVDLVWFDEIFWIDKY